MENSLIFVPNKFECHKYPFLFKLTNFYLAFFVFLLTWSNFIFVDIMGHNLSMVTISGWILLLLWMINLVFNGMRLSFDKIFFLGGMFFWCIISLFWTINVNSTLNQLRVFSACILFYCILIDCINTPSKLKVLWQSYLLGMLMCCMVIIGQAITDNFLYLGMRATAFSYNPNDMAFLLLLPLPIIGYLSCSTNSNLQKILNYTYWILAPLCIILTCSLSGFLALSLICLHELIFNFKTVTKAKNKRFIWITLVTYVLFLSFFNPHYGIFRSLDNIRYSILQSVSALISYSIHFKIKFSHHLINNMIVHMADHRLYIWQEGLRIASQHFMIGFGFGTFEDAFYNQTRAAHAAHNILLNLFLETGLIGVLIFFCLAIWLNKKVSSTVWGSRFITLFLAWFWMALLNPTIFLMKETWLIFSTMVLINTFHQKQISTK